VALALALTLACAAAAQTGAPAATDASTLPPEVRGALAAAKVPASALSVVVEEAGSGRSVLRWNAEVPVNPASLV
jgi:D-alanyl-D-alanine carboxypeptidase/D-alanyl-D-alanine-endopeptidase (penicillin-binding protein 4)